MAQRFPMTPAGKDRLSREVDYLKNIERPRISLQIETARAHGDLKENAEYHSAKEKQGMVEARLREMEARLSRAEVIDPQKLDGTRVVFGATVELLDMDSDEELHYSIVGADEADFRIGLLSYQSPIAQGILGKEEGDEAIIHTGNGKRTLEIVNVEFRTIEIPKSTVIPDEHQA